MSTPVTSDCDTCGIPDRSFFYYLRLKTDVTYIFIVFNVDDSSPKKRSILSFS